MTTAAVFVGQGCCKAHTTCVKKRDRDEGARRHRGYKLGLIGTSSAGEHEEQGAVKQAVMRSSTSLCH